MLASGSPLSWATGIFIQVLNIFQTHYPERLAESLVINVPFLIHAFFKMIGPFMDPVTRNKLKFNPKPIQDGMFVADELFKEGGWGGSRDFVWEHEKYWPAFVRMSDEIREGQMARWRKLGARVGCDEKDYKLEDFVRVVPASPVTATAKAEAEVEAKADGNGGHGLADDAALESGEVVEDAPQSADETSAAEKVSEADRALEPTAV